MNKIIGVLLIAVFFISGFVLTVELTDLDMSEWNFTGSDYAKGLVTFAPHIYLVICGGAMAISATKRGKK